jgi:hypothetical protein
MVKNLKDSFIFDTSALISLASVGLIGNIIKYFNVISTESVIKELEDFSKFEDTYGNTSKEVLKYKDNFVIKSAKIIKKIEFIEETDNELFNLSLKEKIMLITDDIKISYHTSKDIETNFSTFFLGLFIGAKIISKEDAIDKLEKLRNLRNWKNNIIYLVTKKELEDL